MAVVDLNNFEDTTNGYPVKAFQVGGVTPISFLGKASITSGNSIASVYRLAKLPIDAIPLSLEVFSSANITDVNDADLGFYKDAQFGGGVLDVNVLADAIDLSTAKPLSAAGLFGLKSLAVTDMGKTIRELLSIGRSEYQTVDLALTINVAAGASGTIWVRGTFLYGA